MKSIRQWRPRGSDLSSSLLDDSANLPQLLLRQSVTRGILHHGLHPELGFTVGEIHVKVRPLFLPIEEVEPVAPVAEDRRAYASVYHTRWTKRNAGLDAEGGSLQEIRARRRVHTLGFPVINPWRRRELGGKGGQPLPTG